MSMRKPAPCEDDADDLEILHPERMIEIDGVKVTMREYGFVEGMRLAALAAPVVHDLSLITCDATDGGLLEYARLQTVFADHMGAIIAMIAQACDQPRAWVEGLRDADGQTLLLAWWSANGPFFVRRVLTETQLRLAARLSVGVPSTPRSPQPDMGTPSSLDAAPVVN